MLHGHCLLEIKAADGASRRITGVATTPALDRSGDILDPLGATFTNPLPLLWHHDKERPVGRVILHRPTAEGITFEAELPVIAEPGPLRDRVEEAWQSIKAGLITGVSVGYRHLENGVRLLKSGGRFFTATEICELSLVTVPANLQASIQTIKSLDATYLAASGLSPSGVPEALPVVRITKGGPAMTAQERVTDFQNARAAKVAAMASIMDGAVDTTLPEDQQARYDALAIEVKSIDGHLARAKELEQLQASAAVRVPGRVEVQTQQPVVSVKSNALPGTAFVRAAMAILCTRSRYEAIEYAKRWDREMPEVGLYLKAAVAPGTTTDPAWAGALVPTNISSEFLELLRPATILGKIKGLRQVPFNTQVPVQTAGGSYGWVGQGAGKPVTALTFASVRVDMTKAAGIVVLTEELVRSSNPSAERVVRDDMIAGIAAFLDAQFIEPSVAAVAGVNPASITNGIVGTPTTGDIPADLFALLSKFAAANVPMAGAALIMSESNALAMGMVRDGNGNRMFPAVNVNGGTAEGLQIITSNAALTNVILVSPPAILFADDGGVSIDVSREASVEMNSVPDGSIALTSLWQKNLVGLRAERFINWKRGQDAGVALITGASYTIEPPPSLP